MVAWDVAVIGGGVAGSIVSALLAQGGLRVILLEKGTFPREKVCGEFLSPDGVDLLQRLGVWPQLEHVSSVPIRTLTLSARRRTIQCVLPRAGRSVSRWNLDHLLWEYAQAAGVEAWDRSPVTDVEGNFAQGFSLGLQRPGHPVQRIHARVIMCAAGRQWGRRRPAADAHHTRRPQFVGFKAHFQGVELDQRIELHTVSDAYCGVVALEDTVVNLCCLARTDALRRAGGTLDRFYASMLMQNPHLHARMRGAKRLGPRWTTVGFTYARRPMPVEDGFWRVGDSSGMIAPLTGDGMGMAVCTAELAAATALAAFRGDLVWERTTAEYARRWQREFASRLRWGHRLETILLSPRLAILACRSLGLVPSLIDLVYRRTRRWSGPELQGGVRQSFAIAFDSQSLPPAEGARNSG